MSVVVIAAERDREAWRQPIQERLPDIEILAWPDIGDPGAVEIAVVHHAAIDVLRRLPNLRAVIGMWAGVDHILTRPGLPDVPIARMVDPLIARDIGHYVVLHALRHVRSMPQMAANQRARRWQPVAPPPVELRAGILGMGAVGTAAARMLRDLGFAVRGWTRTPRAGGGIPCLAGRAALAEVLSAADICVCTLPLTAATEGIVNAGTLAWLPRGAYFINAGRGRHVVEEDLLAALESGQLAGAALDVLREEPPPADSPFWDHPRVTITPHNAADPRPEAVAGALAANIRRALAGTPMLNLVDRDRGY